MTSHMNRWTAALAWTVSMAIVWALFVPRGISVATFILLGVTSLLALFVGGVLVRDSQPPRSVAQILSELEGGSTPPGPTLKT